MRIAEVRRKTRETELYVKVNIDGSGTCDIETPYGFLSHMLEQLGLHSGMDLTVGAEGDTHVDPHHTVEDTGTALGEALSKALGDRKGIERYGWAMLAMDEARCDVSVDLSGRSYLIYNVDFPVPWDRKEDFDYSLIKEFLSAFTRTFKGALHFNLAYGDNNHHIAEALFKGLAKALGQAFAPTGMDIPSTKGII